MTCKFAWCRETGNHDTHHGRLATASADGNEIGVYIVLDNFPGGPTLDYQFEMEWGIATGDGPREFAALRAIIDQIEAVVTEAEKVYPQEMLA